MEYLRRKKDSFSKNLECTWTDRSEACNNYLNKKNLAKSYYTTIGKVFSFYQKYLSRFMPACSITLTAGVFPIFIVSAWFSTPWHFTIKINEVTSLSPTVFLPYSSSQLQPGRGFIEYCTLIRVIWSLLWFFYHCHLIE